MQHVNEYHALTEFVNTNLKQHGRQKIVFETAENISENIFQFPITKLLAIPTDSDFVYEIYYKILDRMIDEHTKKYFLTLLKYKTLSREDMIKDLVKSEERKRKKTKLIYTQDVHI